MSNKLKKIIAISALCLILLAAVAVLLIIKLNNSDSKTTSSESVELWKQIPYTYSSESDTTSNGQKTEKDKSYKELFAETIQNKIYELRVRSKNGKTLELKSAYFSDKSTPMAIVSYKNTDNKLCFLILKYKDNKLYKLERESNFKTLSKANVLLLFEDCDVIIERSGLESDLVKQEIFNFFEDEYGAVKFTEYGKKSQEKMDDELSNYGIKSKNYFSYSKNAVKENITSYLSKKLGVKINEK